MWLAAILPVEGSGKWLLLISVLVAAIALLIWRRKLIYWHSELEIELKDVLDEAGNKDSATSAPWIEPGKGVEADDGGLRCCRIWRTARANRCTSWACGRTLVAR